MAKKITDFERLIETGMAADNATLDQMITALEVIRRQRTKSASKSALSLEGQTAGKPVGRPRRMKSADALAVALPPPVINGSVAAEDSTF